MYVSFVVPTMMFWSEYCFAWCLLYVQHEGRLSTADSGWNVTRICSLSASLRLSASVKSNAELEDVILRVYCNKTFCWVLCCWWWLWRLSLSSH